MLTSAITAVITAVLTWLGVPPGPYIAGVWIAVKVVVVAAHFRIDQEAADIGADGWLQKPFDLTRLDDQTRSLCTH